MLWRNFEDRKRKWWREKCTQRAVRFEWSWKEKKRRERDEMLTRTLAQWIFQRVKTLKPVSNIPASIFVLYPWRNFRSRRVRFFNRKLERNRDVRRGVTSHAPKIRDETDSRERVREREGGGRGRERERETFWETISFYSGPFLPSCSSSSVPGFPLIFADWGITNSDINI